MILAFGVSQVTVGPGLNWRVLAHLRCPLLSSASMPDIACNPGAYWAPIEPACSTPDDVPSLCPVLTRLSAG